MPDVHRATRATTRYGTANSSVCSPRRTRTRTPAGGARTRDTARTPDGVVRRPRPLSKELPS
jgi:hypothetical protein